jgi:E3 ubiquitin-protein ligase DOA10
MGCFGLACVEPYDLYNPFMDHTLRLIQHNWIVLAYNFNVVILVLIIGESSISAISAYHFLTVFSLLLPCIIILFLHLLSANHKCTQPCYFPLLLKPVAQKVKLDWNSSMKSSRLCITSIAVPMKL